MRTSTRKRSAWLLSVPTVSSSVDGHWPRECTLRIGEVESVIVLQNAVLRQLEEGLRDRGRSGSHILSGLIDHIRPGYFDGRDGRGEADGPRVVEDEAGDAGAALVHRDADGVR